MVETGNVCKTWFGRVARAWWLSLLLVAAGTIAAEAAPFAYVTNSASNTVSVIDTAANTVVAAVPVGGAPQGVAITPDGAFAYRCVESVSADSDREMQRFVVAVACAR